MFVPLYDNNSLKRIKFQYVTYLLIALNVGVFAFFQNGLQLDANLNPVLKERGTVCE